MMLICSIIFFFSFPLYNASKNKTELLHVIDPTLDPKESCVICKYAFQKLMKLISLSEECPDMLDIPHIRERQRQWQPDPDYFNKWKILFEAQQKEEQNRASGIRPDGDHVYYVAAKIKNNTCVDNTFISSQKQTKSESSRKIFTTNTAEVLHELETPVMKKIKINELPVKLTEMQKSFLWNKDSDQRTFGSNDHISDNVGGDNAQTSFNSNSLTVPNDEIQTSNGLNLISNQNIMVLSATKDDDDNSNHEENCNKTEPSKKNVGLIERKKITFEDTDHTIPEMPHQFVLSHEFLNTTKQDCDEDKTKKENSDSSKTSNEIKIDNIDKLSNLYSNTNNANNVISNKNVLHLNSAMNLLNKLNNDTFRKMEEIDKKIDVLPNFKAKNETSSSLLNNKSKASSLPTNNKSKSLDFLHSFRFRDHPIFFLSSVERLKFSKNSKLKSKNTKSLLKTKSSTHKLKKIKSEEPWFNSYSANNINIISNTNIINSNDCEKDNCPDPEPYNPHNSSDNNDTNDGNSTQKKHLAYYDVRHPSTKKIIDKNKGTITTITDLGSVVKTVVMNPEDVESYQDVEHALDDQFEESDKVLHWNNKTDPTTYSKSYDALDSIKEADDQELVGSSTTSELENTTQTNYTYNTSIEVNSPKQYLIKRVHTNKESGVLVNEKKYDYGKTVNTYDYGDVYKNEENIEPSKNKKTNLKKGVKESYPSSNSESDFHINPNGGEIKVNQISQLTIGGEAEESHSNCCIVEPCLRLKPCFISETQKKLQKAYISSFLEVMSKIKLNINNEGIRKRSRFPDSQWNCYKNGVNDVFNFLCEQEFPKSYEKYCKPLREQANIIIEQLLYHDSIDNICCNINMCQ